MVIGAWRDDDNGGNSGAAYVFRFDAPVNRWVEEQKLLPEDGAAGERFGLDVSMSDGVAARAVRAGAAGCCTLFCTASRPPLRGVR